MQRDYIHYRDNAGCVGNIHKLVRMVEQLVRQTVPNPPTSEPTTFMTMTSSAPGPLTSNVIDSGDGPLDHHHPHGTAVAPPNPENSLAARAAADSGNGWAFRRLKNWGFLRRRPAAEAPGQ
ncbi:hypothetical protein NKR19_g6877 [Coniochaeta hoffmannii]|uniref:Uncharacterized protein n=1 Tax=Coniochaeta hoffmannii TaxID=91930 RepID=A0AA38RAC4_9PEZI|nr:hypothetical protein NKR19_g6877 [Coniochaeta hoffmannii]